VTKSDKHLVTHVTDRRSECWQLNYVSKSLHGYCIHNSVWIAAVGEELPCE